MLLHQVHQALLAPPASHPVTNPVQIQAVQLHPVLLGKLAQQGIPAPMPVQLALPALHLVEMPMQMTSVLHPAKPSPQAQIQVQLMLVQLLPVPPELK